MPDSITLWFLIAGGLLVVMALAGSVLKRLPLSASMLYLLAGMAIGPYGWGLLHLDPFHNVELLELLSEIAVLVSLFTTGMKLGPPLSNPRWWLSIRLAFVAMMLTVGFIAWAGVIFLKLPLGAAILLGAILAPTDPVLAADVQVDDHNDRDRLRFGLSSEAGLNDGAAFPFVLLGLGLLGLHNLGPFGGRWLGIDVFWSIGMGLASGFTFGALVASLVLYLRKNHKEAIGLDEFLTLGLMALSYGAAHLIYASGFLAVFAAGVALRRIEQREIENAPTEETEETATNAYNTIPEGIQAVRTEEELATDAKIAPTFLVHAVLSFNEQLERLGQVTLVLLMGGMLTLAAFSPEALWFIPFLFLLVRPLAVHISFLGSRTSVIQKALISWFGIRGIGSLYYLMFAIHHGLPESLARQLAGLTFATIAASIFLHGISVTPLMNRYRGPRE